VGKALSGVDMRAKLYSVLRALDFSSNLPYTTEQRLLLTAVREYVPFAAAEAWRDVKEELLTDELEPLLVHLGLLAAGGVAGD